MEKIAVCQEVMDTTKMLLYSIEAKSDIL